jgi:hypothetical protein
MTRSKPKRELFECPNCGADVPVGRKACAECGSDAETGWQSSEEIDYQGVELPQGYTVDPEHPDRVVATRKLSPWVVVVVVLTALGFVLLVVLR